MGRVSQGEFGVIPNNNFYGKKCGKTIRDFTVDLDYKLDTVQDRIDFLNSRLEVSKVGDIEFAHDFFIELFDQTFDGNINTSSVKLLLNSEDAQYSESNIANDLSRLADYILVKDKREPKEKVKLYSEEEFIKRLYTEKNKLEPLENVNGDDFIILKRVGNYRLAPKMTINSSDFKLPLIYRGTYEDYLEHWSSHQYKKVFLDGKYKKVYLDKKDFSNISTSVCMTEEQWTKGRKNMLEKIELLSQAEENRQALMNKKDGCKISGAPVKRVVNNIGDINEYMKSVKTSYHNYVSITPDKCPSNVDMMSIVDYSNEKHVEALICLQGSKKDLKNDMAILMYDIDNAIKKVFDAGLLDKTDLDIIHLLRQGLSKERISKKKNFSRMTLHRRLKKIVVTVMGALQG